MKPYHLIQDHFSLPRTVRGRTFMFPHVDGALALNAGCFPSLLLCDATVESGIIYRTGHDSQGL